MPEFSSLGDSNNRRNSYVLALFGFDVTKKSLCIASFLLILEKLLFLSLTHAALIHDLFEQSHT